MVGLDVVMGTIPAGTSAATLFLLAAALLASGVYLLRESLRAGNRTTSIRDLVTRLAAGGNSSMPPQLLGGVLIVVALVLLAAAFGRL